MFCYLLLYAKENASRQWGTALASNRICIGVDNAYGAELI